MPASKHMVVLGKRRTLGKQTLMLGPAFEPGTGRTSENPLVEPRSRRPRPSVPRES